MDLNENRWDKRDPGPVGGPIIDRREPDDGT